MAAITVSREFGSDGQTVARRIAEALGFENFDKRLLVEVAQKAQVPVSEVERYDEQPEHPALRVLRKFLTPGYADTLTGLSEYEWWATATVPELSNKTEKALATLDEEVYVKLTAEVMSQLADQGKVVLVGRGGQSLLAGRPDVLHIRVVATQEFKIKTVQKRDEVDAQGALKRIKEVNEKRKTYIRRHYNVNWDDARLYDLTVNTGLMGVDQAVEVVVAAARRLG